MSLDFVTLLEPRQIKSGIATDDETFLTSLIPFDESDNENNKCLTYDDDDDGDPNSLLLVAKQSGQRV